MYWAARMWAEATCTRQGISLNIERKCKTPYATKNSIVMPPYPVGGSREEQLIWEYSFGHETCHHKRPQDFDLLRKEKINIKSPLGYVLNVLDDTVIERQPRGEYVGFDRRMEAGRYVFSTKMIWPALKEKSDDPMANKLDALWAFEGEMRKDFLRSFHSEFFRDMISDGAKVFYDKLVEGVPVSEYQTMGDGSPYEILEMAKKICGILELPEDGEGKGGEKGEKGESEEGESGEKGSGIKEPTEVPEDYKDMLIHEHDEETVNKAVSEVVKKESLAHYGEYIPSKTEVVYLSRGEVPKHFSSPRTLTLPEGGDISRQVQRYLMSETLNREMRNQRRGKIHGSSLHKLITREGRSRTAVFSKPDTSMGLDVAVSVLVDASGSMAWSKFEHAAKSGILLNQVCRSIGIPLEIAAFTDYHEPNYHLILKEFGQRMSDEALTDNFSKTFSLLRDNADGENIIIAAERLLGRPEQKKVLIVLSDGSPSTGAGRGDIVEFTAKIIRFVENKTPVEIHGIGIMDDSVESFYKSWSVISSADKLEHALLTVLKKKVL